MGPNCWEVAEDKTQTVTEEFLNFFDKPE